MVVYTRNGTLFCQIGTHGDWIKEIWKRLNTAILTKGAVRIRISKKKRQHNGQKKKVQKGKEDIYWIGAETTNRSLLTSVSLVEQELLTLPKDLSSPPPPDFSGVRFTRSLVLYICFVDRCLSFWSLCCLFSFDLRILINPLVSSNSSCLLCSSTMTFAMHVALIYVRYKLKVEWCIRFFPSLCGRWFTTQRRN
jgi:hypothetical protein